LDLGACRCLENVAEGVQDRFVTNNLDALLTALYVDLDDRVLPALGWSRDHRPGRKPALSDAELIAYLTRCRDHHSAMIAQHMRFTAGAVIPTSDFLAHVGDWTGLPPSDLLGLMRGSAAVSSSLSRRRPM